MPPRARIRILDPLAFSSASSSPLCTQCFRQVPKPRFVRPISSTPAPQASRMRQEFYRWLEGPGSSFKEPLPDSTNYLNAYDAAGNLIRMRRETTGEVEEGDRGKEIPRESKDDLQVFPMNPHFVSESVLSEESKDLIWKMVMQEGKSVREVSNLVGVDMNRVGAVVRLKGVEKDWIDKGRPLANAYNRAMLGMLPKTELRPSRNSPISERRHESINDLNVHPSTKEQIFYPASESRHFTRSDAGQVFEKGLKSADERLPHPEAIEFYRNRETQEGRAASEDKLGEFYSKKLQRFQKKATKQAERKERNTIKVEGDRAIFQITHVQVDEHTVGKDGRSPLGVGVRYGFPHEDRKKGQIKIPTSVR